MKRSIPWVALASFCVFGVFLIFQMATEKPLYEIRQKSNYAIINVSDPEMADALANGEIVIKTDNPNARTLIRVTSGEPTRFYGKLKSDAPLYIINPAGVIVGPGFPSSQDRAVSLIKTDTSSTLETKLIPHGNVYALAIRENGGIRAVEVVKPVSKPTP